MLEHTKQSSVSDPLPLDQSRTKVTAHKQLCGALEPTPPHSLLLGYKGTEQCCHSGCVLNSKNKVRSFQMVSTWLESPQKKIPLLSSTPMAPGTGTGRCRPRHPRTRHSCNVLTKRIINNCVYLVM